MTITTTQLIAALQNPAAYPHKCDHIELKQTHISLVFLADEIVYKIKKALDLGFLDYSTLALRKHFCEEEVRLNRRLAPDVYLGVSTITREGDGSIAVDGSGEAVEYAVRMKRLPQERMLDQMLKRGEATNDHIDELVRVIADFHSAAATGPDINNYAQPDLIRSEIDDNFCALRKHAVEPGWMDDQLCHYLEQWAAAQLDEHQALILQRIEQGRVRDGHGDLHSRNICLTESGVVIYDCIEFTPRFRCRDVASEIAYLAMDLDLRGGRRLSRRLVDGYIAATGDESMRRLLPLFQLHFAIVRAKVAAIEAGESELSAEARARAQQEAMEYINLAAGYALRPGLILMCGLPATGKSWAAHAIADGCAATMLRSDVIRKSLIDINPNDPAPRSAYSSEMNDRTYSELRTQAAEHLAMGELVICDATFAGRQRRESFRDLARQHNAPLIVVHTTAPDEVIRQRLQQRRDDASEVSDADIEVYERMKANFAAPDEFPESQRVEVTPDTPAPIIVTKVVQALLRQRTNEAESHTRVAETGTG